jgi:hypothetical protein
VVTPRGGPRPLDWQLLCGEAGLTRREEEEEGVWDSGEVEGMASGEGDGVAQRWKKMMKYNGHFTYALYKVTVTSYTTN